MSKISNKFDGSRISDLKTTFQGKANQAKQKVKIAKEAKDSFSLDALKPNSLIKNMNTSLKAKLFSNDISEVREKSAEELAGNEPLGVLALVANVLSNKSTNKTSDS